MKRAGTTVGAVLAAMALVAAGSAVVAQDPSAAPGEPESGTLVAVIRDGSCAEPGDVAALLTDVEAQAATDSESGEADPGAGDVAAPVRTSITEVTMPLSEVVAGQHVLALEDAGSGRAVACGSISGTIVDDGLAIALHSLEDSGVSGIGWLLGVGLEATRVHVFVTPTDGSGPSQPEEEPDEPDGPSPSPSPAAGGGDQPDPEPDPVPDPDIDPGDDIDVDV